MVVFDFAPFLSVSAEDSSPLGPTSKSDTDHNGKNAPLRSIFMRTLCKLTAGRYNNKGAMEIKSELTDYIRRMNISGTTQD